jgi:hypothetical protein
MYWDFQRRILFFDQGQGRCNSRYRWSNLFLCCLYGGIVWIPADVGLLLAKESHEKIKMEHINHFFSIRSRACSLPVWYCLDESCLFFIGEVRLKKVYDFSP